MQGLGGIAALLGVLGLLLSGASPAMAHAPLARTADSVSTARQHPAPMAAAPAAPATVSAIDGAAPDAPPADCPQHHARACCSVAGCTSAVALATDPPRAGMRLSLPDAFSRTAARAQTGVAGLPLTPPPRRDI